MISQSGSRWFPSRESVVALFKALLHQEFTTTKIDKAKTQSGNAKWDCGQVQEKKQNNLQHK